MKLPSLRIAALSAAFAFAACGGGKSEEGNGSGASPAPPPSRAPAPGPAPGPAPAPSPSPAPPSAPAPSPSPAPAPAPPSQEVVRGAMLYQRECATCHGSDPEVGTQGIYKGVTPAVLRAAYGRVQVMNAFASTLSSRDTEDLAAYISYRVGLP
ncbi:MAG: cytochrome c [Burkholderiales bacterium]|nr:cytochrome c [Burkholderiales bacterium]